MCRCSPPGGRLVAREPYKRGDLGRDVRGAEVFRHLAIAPADTFVANAIIDSVRRLYAYRQVSGLPLVVSVGLSEHGIYAAWNRMALVVMAAMACMLLLASSVTWMLRRELRSRTWAEHAARLASSAAQESAACLRLITDGAGDLLLTVDWDGLRRYVSPSCQRLLGRPAAEMIGRSWLERLHPDDRAPLIRVLSALQSGAPSPGPLTSRVQCMDDSWRWLEALGRRLPDGSGAVFVIRDVTDRVRMESRLDHSQRVEAVGRLTAGVAHDFNNVLQALLGGLELAIEEVADRPSVRDELEAALQAGLRGARLTSHLLSFSRQQMLSPTVLHLPPLLTELSRTLQRTLGRDIRINIAVQPGLPPVMADAAHLDSALLNLAVNARDAMPHGGTLDIAASVTDGAVVIAVSDTGEGMGPEVAAHACEPFFSTKGIRGSGLGLSMAQGFARQSNGTLRIHSTPGAGTCIEIGLPIAVAPAAPAPAPEPAREHTSGRGRVLVVDDDLDVGRIAASFLCKAGFKVATASSGDGALALLTAQPPFDALVSDFAMLGMDGAELVQQAREICPGLPALVITGYAGASALERLDESVTILRKPFQREDLVGAVNAMMHATPPEAIQTATSCVG